MTEAAPRRAIAAAADILPPDSGPTAAVPPLSAAGTALAAAQALAKKATAAATLRAYKADGAFA